VPIIAIFTIGAVVGAAAVSPTIHGATNATGCSRSLVASIGAAAAVAVAVAGAIVATAWDVARRVDAIAVGAMVGCGSSLTHCEV
jgi:hypothetical protein